VTVIPPWLGHLRTDRRGICVPWINLWGPEDVARMSVRYDRHVRQRAVFMDDTGQTVPDFRAQCIQRQREAMAGGLCQVCGRPVPWRRRCLVVSDMSVETITYQGRRVPVVTEPWLDERCATFAMRHCPALIRRTREEALSLVPITSPRDVRMHVSTGWVEGPLKAETTREPVAMWVKAALLAVEIREAS
jgi:hypothetical protein